MTRASIVARPQAEVTADRIVLADVAVVKSQNPSLAQKLRRLELSPSPNPGKSWFINRFDIIVALRRAGIDDKTVDLLSPEKIEVQRRFTLVTGQMLLRAVQEFAMKSASWPGTMTVDSAHLPAELEVPCGKLELRAREGVQRLRRGQNCLPVDIIVDAQTYRTVNLSLIIKVVAPVLTARKSISRGDSIDASNTSIEIRDITDISDDVATEAFPAGWTAVMSLAEGTVIRQNFISEPAAVHAGDKVVVLVESGQVRITGKATATQDGHIGQTITVRFENPDREVRGKVAEAGVIRI
jgi:flagella basal body P-ring formation protein FlgA